MICVGDLHITSTPVYMQAKIKLLDWLVKNYIDETIIFLGDLFDVNYVHSDIIFHTMDMLKKFKKVYLLTGNHDILRYKKFGNILAPFEHFDNITVITDVFEETIDNNKCLFLPYQNDFKLMKDYELLTGEYDLIATHVTPYFCAFGDEGLNLNLTGHYLHGHTHISEIKVDNNGNEHEVIGIPTPTRNGEQDQEHYILQINEDKSRVKITVPLFMTIQTIKFGDAIDNKDNLYNVIDAPDKKSVYEMYKDFYIRDEGIKFISSSEEEGFKNVTIDSFNLKSNFKSFSEKESINKDITNLCLQYLD